MIARLVLGIFGVCIAVYAAMTGYLYTYQSDIIFDNAYVDADHDWGFAGDVELVQLNRETALVHGAYHPGPGTAGLTADDPAIVVFFHGNGQNLGASTKMAAMFAKLGYGLLAAERRESGKSYGLLNEDAMIADAVAWYDYARSRWPDADIRVAGYSMGTAWAAALAAARPELRDVVLFAPFESLLFMAKHRSWYMPEILIDMVMAFPLRSDLNILRAEKTRFRIYHGTADPTVPYSSGAALQTRFNGDDSFITIDGADHWQVIWNEKTFEDLKSAWGRLALNTP